MSEKISFRARVKSRRNAMQVLYSFHLNERDPNTVIAEYLSDSERCKGMDKDYFRSLVLGTIDARKKLNACFEKHLDRPLKELDPIELSILQLGCYELCCHSEVPWRVIINDAVNLAHMFGGKQSYKYINRLLDIVAAQERGRQTTESEP